MSASPAHYKCPNPSLPWWSKQKSSGRQEIVYWRKPVEITNPRPYGRRTVHKRVWVRVGLVCMDCGLFTPDAGAIGAGIPATSPGDQAGLPNGDRPTVDHDIASTVDQVRPQ